MPPSTSFTPSASLLAPAVAAINHLLGQEAWAREALALHAGKEALIDGGSVALRLRVTRDGMLEQSMAEQSANVTIRVRLADLPLIAQTPARAFSYVKIEGDAELANTISQLSKGLRWDAEHDLEPWLGPIGATRLVRGARSAFHTARATHRKLAENVAEFFLEEQPMLVRPLEVVDFASEVNRLRDDVERSAKRIARLEQQLAPGAGTVAPPAPPGQQKLDL